MEWKRNDFEDPLGFTKQTAMMLVGLGAGDLIPEFKKRNISSRNLVELNKNDLIALGANDGLAETMLKELRSASRKFCSRNVSDEQRTNEILKVLVGGNNQLNLMETFAAYARLRLVENPQDFVIDSTKNIRASQALCVAAVRTIQELEQLEKKWEQLRIALIDDDRRRGKKLSLMGLITGVGLIGTLAFALKCARASAAT